MALWLKLLLVSIAFTALYFIFVQIQLPSCLNEVPVPLQAKAIRPIVKVYDLNSSDGHLSIVKSVFSKLGYIIKDRNATDWDVLWSHPYPFHGLRNEIAHLKPHQKVNHFPGSGVLTQKANLVLLPVRHIPKAFVMPSQKESFLTYNKRNASKLWIQKSNMHRGIKILNLNSLDLDSEGTFIQEYVSNPLLINQRKFDIGVYIVLTSVDPLRVYMYSTDILLRFCTEKYYPFNSSALESYVVEDDYLPIWKVPSLKKFFVDLNYTAKDSLNAYLLQQKRNPEKLWSQIAETIQDIFMKTESAIIKAALKLGILRNFFELLRFDFVVDEDLNVFLLEANMSPNLSAEHFPQNKMLYEQVLFNVLSIMGLIRKFPDTILNSDELEVSSKDIQVFPEECSSKACNNTCRIQKCAVCNFCLTSELKGVAKAAYLEHMNRDKFRRLVPIPSDLKMSHVFSHARLARLSEMNSFMSRWFKGKCLQDRTFCQ